MSKGRVIRPTSFVQHWSLDPTPEDDCCHQSRSWSVYDDLKPISTHQDGGRTETGSHLSANLALWEAVCASRSNPQTLAVIYGRKLVKEYNF